MNKPGTKPDPNKVYKRDNKGKFAKVNSLLKKIAMAKAQGVPHVPPGKTNKVPPPFSALKNPAAKKLGHDLYMRKKAGEFAHDHAIYLAAAKLAAHHKKQHPSASTGMSANQIVNAYKRHEYDEVGFVTLLGQISGNINQLKRDGPGSDWTPSGKPNPPSKPTIDKTKTGLNITSDKFSKPDTLKPTGKTLGGVTGAKVYTDAKGQQWVVKTPKTGSNAYGNKSFMVDVEIAASRIQNKAGLPVPAMHEEEVDGKHSAVSKMYVGPNGGPVTEAFPKGKGLDIATMSPEDIIELQKNQFLDWLMSNHDSHSANFLRTEDGIVGIDKGQAFKFFGKDKLSYNYEPVTPLDGNVPVYQRIWKQFAQGKGELFDPNGPELKSTIERIQNIPDADIRKLLRPYATKAAASGSLSMPNKPAGASKSELVNHFLDEVVKRKNNLSKDFGDYYALVKSEHDKNAAPGLTAATHWAAPKTKAKAGAGVPASGSGVGKPTINDKYTPFEQHQKGIISTQELKDMSSPVGAYEDLKVGDKLLSLYDDGSIDDIVEITSITPSAKAGSAPNMGAKYKSLLGGPSSGEFYPNFFEGSNSDGTYKIPEKGSKLPGGKPTGSGKPVGAQVFPSDIKPGMYVSMVVMGTPQKPNKLGALMKVDKIVGDDVYLTNQKDGKQLDVKLDFFKAGNFVVADPNGGGQKITDMDIWHPSGMINDGEVDALIKKTDNDFELASVKFEDVVVGDVIYDDTEGDGLYYVVKGKSHNAIEITQFNGYNKNDDMAPIGKAEWEEVWDGKVHGSFKVVKSASAGNAPELNKPIKSLAGLKVGDKIQSGYGVDFTITEFGSDGNGKYATAVDSKGAFAGNFYEDSFANQPKGMDWIYVGNINNQGSVDANDLAGQKVSNSMDLVPGDKITVMVNSHWVDAVVSNVNNAPDFIYVKKKSTGAVVKIDQLSFKGGFVKYTARDSKFEPVLGGQPKHLDIGQEVLITGDEGPDVPVKVNIANIDEDGNGNIQSILVTSPQGDEEWEYVPVKGSDGKIHWVDDPSEFINNNVGLYSELGLPGSAPKPKGKLKIEGELAKDVNGVEIGDVVLSQSSTSDAYFKVIKLNAGYNGTAVEVINMDDGSTELIFDYEFDKGYVTWGDQNATSISGNTILAPPKQDWPTYPASDLYTGSLAAKNVPGTTLQNKTLLPGWGVYKGELDANDEVVAYGPNGEFKKGSVVQSAGGPHFVYITWDDDPTGDWVEFTKTSNGGFWGDGGVSGVDSYTLIGKATSATANPPQQMPVGPHAATQASSIPTVTSPDKGKAANFDNLTVGMVYHIPGGKMQKVISKDADSFTAQSVSGNTHTYPKEKFNTWAANKGALLGMPGDDDPAPPLGDVAKDNVYIVPLDPFDQSGSQTKYTVKSQTSKNIVLKDVSTGGEKTVPVSEWDSEAKGWKQVQGISDWEKYSQGIITWEEYQETTGHKEVAKLHSPEGPAAPGKPSPAAAFGGKKARKEIKPPPPWSAIKGDPVIVKELGAQIWELKKAGEFGGDEMMLWKACEKVRRVYVKNHPGATDVPSKNQIRHAARRFEYEANGYVVWETAEQQTAQVVGNVQTAKSAVYHVPSGKYTSIHDSNKVPLTAFGDSKKLAGSYQNPINFGASHYDVTPGMALWGKASNPQSGTHFTSSEKHAVGWYTGNGAKDHINPYLRSGSVGYGNPAKIQKAVKDMDAAMAKSNPIEDWTIITRGAYGGYDVGINHSNSTLDEVRAQIGKTVLNKGYSSTSLGSKPAFGGSFRIIYRVPPGLKGLWVAGSGSGPKLSSCSSSEREFILPRNLKVKVVAANEHTDNLGYKFDVVVEIVGWEGQGK